MMELPGYMLKHINGLQCTIDCFYGIAMHAVNNIKDTAYPLNRLVGEGEGDSPIQADIYLLIKYVI